MTALSNFCKRKIMSVCTASTDEMETCVYYKKSTTKTGCMYFIFDEYCDCLGAQIDAASDKEITHEKQTS